MVTGRFLVSPTAKVAGSGLHGCPGAALAEATSGGRVKTEVTAAAPA